MSWRSTLILAALGLTSAWIVSAFQHYPGYMDADYYFAGGLRLASGHGFSELILWNYLDDPAGLPHPSHAYWMPLTSLIAAAGMAVLDRLDFSAAQLGFVLLSACIPPLTAALARRLTQRRDLSLLAGGLSLLPVFYSPYLPTSDSFAVGMLLGGLFISILPSDRPSSAGVDQLAPLRLFGLGILSGGLHLTRAEGGLWLLAALVAILMYDTKQPEGLEMRKLLRHVSVCVFGYLLIVGPWFARNMAVFGTPLSPAGGKVLWIREYNDLFIYPASQLNFDYWRQSGLDLILRARLWAAGQNAQTAIGVQGEIFLLPLILAGMWRLRNDLRVHLAGMIWLSLFFLMTLLFPFQGARGGFFHAGAALQPFFWAVAPLGLESFLEWGANKRGWQIFQARKFFTAGALGLALLLTVIVTRGRFSSSPDGGDAWNAGGERYAQIERFLLSDLAGLSETVMVNNAPGYFAATGRPAISIPYTDLEHLCSAARRYHAEFLLLEIDQIVGESLLYDKPQDRECLAYLDSVAETRIYRIIRH